MTFARVSVISWIAALAVVFAQVPQAPAQPAMPPAFGQQELDQMLAPIALYPDPLLSQILMAATYPLEVVEAARWSRANPGLRGEAAVRAVSGYPWDPSVQSLVAFPQVLATMDQRLDWTQRLGNAFLAQQAQVMDTIQALRRRAYEAGNLASDDRIAVGERAGVIVLEPANPQLFYVPYYDPLVVYGGWWWPGYPPVYWPAWPGYASGPTFAAGLLWGAGVALAADFFFGDWDWNHRHVMERPVTNFYYRHRGPSAPVVWQHEPAHRRNVPYRGEAARRQFVRPPAAPASDARRGFRGYDPSDIGAQVPPRIRAPAPAPRTAAPSQSDIGAGVAPRIRAPAVAPRPTAPSPSDVGAGVPPRIRAPAPARSAAPRPQARPQAGTAAARPAPRAESGAAARPEPAPRAFEGIRAGGGQTRQFSARGQASMQRPQAPAPAPRDAAGAGRAPVQRK